MTVVRGFFTRPEDESGDMLCVRSNAHAIVETMTDDPGNVLVGANDADAVAAVGRNGRIRQQITDRLRPRKAERLNAIAVLPRTNAEVVPEAVRISVGHVWRAGIQAVRDIRDVLHLNRSLRKNY